MRWNRAARLRKPHAGLRPAVAADLDLRRIVRALSRRERYKYVAPEVVATEAGYLIRSPNCSRTVDPDGGEIDIALLTRDPAGGQWLVYRKDDVSGEWCLHAQRTRLTDLLDEEILPDPQKVFWR